MNFLKHLLNNIIDRMSKKFIKQVKKINWVNQKLTVLYNTSKIFDTLASRFMDNMQRLFFGELNNQIIRKVKENHLFH